MNGGAELMRVVVTGALGYAWQRAGAAAGGGARPSRDRARHPPARSGSPAGGRRTPSSNRSVLFYIRDRSGDEAGARRCRRRRPLPRRWSAIGPATPTAEGARSINEMAQPERDRGDAGGRPARLPQHDQHHGARRAAVTSAARICLSGRSRSMLYPKARAETWALERGCVALRPATASALSSNFRDDLIIHQVACAACAASICSPFELTGDAQLRACRTSPWAHALEK